MIKKQEKQLREAQKKLTHHPVYTMLDSVDAVRIFMESHVYAVWDFMSLLKSLQRRLTCVDIPWRQSRCPAEVTRFINEIVIGEECDLDPQGRVKSHYQMYLDAMEEVGADTEVIRAFVDTLDYSLIPEGVAPFVQYNLEMAASGRDEEVAAAFLYGREKLIPDMFTTIREVLKREGMQCPTLIYYLERHIELDGGEHGPLAESCLNALCGDDMVRRENALLAGLKSLELRWQLWDSVANRLSGHRVLLASAV